MKGRIVIFLSLILCACTYSPRKVVHTEEELIAVDSTMDAIADTAYMAYLQPIRSDIDEQLNIVIGYAPEDMKVYRPECAMLNWACDALYDMAESVQRGPVDFAVANIGGMRCEWQAGPITQRYVYELMPFDNRLVILTLKGEYVLALLDEFAAQGGQGVSRQLRMEIQDGKAQNIRLNGKEIDPEAYYYIATSDYLSGGADHFDPLVKAIEKHDTGLKIRDLYLKYITSQKEVRGIVDGRMKQL